MKAILSATIARLASERTFLVAIFLFALAVRLTYVISLAPQSLSPDAYGWMAMANDIASGKGVGEAWRPPGFAAFLSVLFFLFGPSVLAGRILNALLGSLTCVLIYFIGKKMFSPGVGKIAAFLLSLYPYLIAYTGDLLSETFLTFMIALSTLMLFTMAEKPTLKNLVTGGLILGMTALTKSTVLPFFFIACFWLWWRTGEMRVGVLAGLFTLLTVLPWTARNYLHYKHFILVSPAYQSLWVSNNDYVSVLETMGELDRPNPPVLFHPPTYGEILRLPRMESEMIFKKEAMEWIRGNPDTFKFLLKRRLVHFWRLYPMMAYPWQKIVAAFTSGIYIPLCFLGLFLSFRNFGKASLILALFIFYTLVHLPFAVTIRYRVPIDPYIIIFASYAMYVLWERLRTTRFPAPGHQRNS